MDEREAQAVQRPLASGWVTQGPEVAALEREFAEYVGAPYASAVSNCTVALHLALLAVGVSTGDEVITVSHSFIASANSIRYCGAVPVFVDIERDTFNLNPLHIERAVSPRTRAIMCIHQLGMPSDMQAILNIARQHNLPVIEDAACAVGSEIEFNGKWEKIGKPHGDIACFSFHPRKLLTTGDGGMLTTANLEHNKFFRLRRQHSMNVPDTIRHGSKEIVFESYATLGYNYRLTDLQAAVGRVQLERLPQAVERRREQAVIYQNLLASVPGVTAPSEPTWARSNWQSYCVRLDHSLDQRKLMQYMLDLGISTRRGVMCAHRETAYPPGTWTCGEHHADAEHANGSCAALRESENAQDHCLLLPLYHTMTQAEQERVVETLAEACAVAKS